MNKQILAAILFVGALGFFFVGYQTARPTTAEKFASGLDSFAASFESNNYKSIQEDLMSQRMKRGLPYYLIGGVLVIGGVVCISRK